MVRHKSRWLLARLDFDDDLFGETAKRSLSSKRNRKCRGVGGDVVANSYFSNAASRISERAIHKTLREMMYAAFGTVGTGMAYSVQGEQYGMNNFLTAVLS